METEGVAELPLVTVLVQQGDAAVELALGPVAESADGTVLAPGTVDEQVAMAVELGNLLLPRLFGAA